MAIQGIKTIAAGKAIPAKTVNVKNADVYEIAYLDGGKTYIFKPTEGSLEAIGESKQNYTIAENSPINFIPKETFYYGVEEKGVKRMTKAEVDAYQAQEAAKVLNTAASTAVEAEKIKGRNIKRTALAVAGIVVLIGGIAAAIYYTNKSKKAA